MSDAMRTWMAAADGGVPGAPAHELTRSAPAAVVGRLAAASGLVMVHFERRGRLELPEHWAPEHRPELLNVPEWSAGRLPESKYQSFRHDLLAGSFHPSHRAKWTTHELCHGLVGFAWRPDASPWFHALAARLAEVLPVALYYFLDEAGLQRCSVHQGRGPLYGEFCLRCEDAARTPGSMAWAGPEMARWRSDGMAFVDRELAAIEESMRLGRPVPHRLGRLDLASDGMAYASAHGARLDSEAMHRFVPSFFPNGAAHGHHSTLEAMVARVRELATALYGDGDAAPLQGQRWRFIAQDLGFRFLQVAEESDGEAQAGLIELADRLAAAPSEDALRGAATGYQSLNEEFELPPPELILALGLPLPGGWGTDSVQMTDGIRSACPGTWRILGNSDAQRQSRVHAFLKEDAFHFERVPLGDRFSQWLGLNQPGPVADLAAYESAVTYAGPADPQAAFLGGAPMAGTQLRVAEGVRVVAGQLDALSLSEAVGAGRIRDLAATDGLEPAPSFYVIGRGPGPDVMVVPVSERVADAVSALIPRGAAGAVPKADLSELLALKLVVPARWR